MDIKLTTDIKDILIEDGSISIPSFGGFTSAYKPALVDAVNGQLAPPSFHIAFDVNLQMNDGRLVEYLRQKYRISSTAAFDCIEAFANEARQNFDKGEIVVLPEIGRLYRDFAQKIQFLPDTTNFNTSSFGLPTLQYAPVSRSKTGSTASTATTPTFGDAQPEPQASTPPITPSLPRQEGQSTPSADVSPAPSFSANESVKTPKNESAPPQKSETVDNTANKNLGGFPTPIDSVKPPIMQETQNSDVFWKEWQEKVKGNWRTWLPAAAVVIVLAFLVWQLNDNTIPKNTEGVKKTRSLEPNVNSSPLQGVEATPKVNVAPPVNGVKPPQVPNNQEDATTITSPELLSEPRKNESTTTRQPNLTPAESSKTAIILIGGFGNKRNIKKLKVQIVALGYSVYERKSGGLTLIGCEFPYETQADVQKILTQLRNKYGEGVELIKR